MGQLTPSPDWKTLALFSLSFFSFTLLSLSVDPRLSIKWLCRRKEEEVEVGVRFPLSLSPPSSSAAGNPTSLNRETGEIDRWWWWWCWRRRR